MKRTRKSLLIGLILVGMIPVLSAQQDDRRNFPQLIIGEWRRCDGANIQWIFDKRGKMTVLRPGEWAPFVYSYQIRGDELIAKDKAITVKFIIETISKQVLVVKDNDGTINEFCQ